MGYFTIALAIPNCVGVTRRVTQTTNALVTAYWELSRRMAPPAGLEPATR